MRQETNTEINQRRRGNDFGKCVHGASLNSGSSWMIRHFRKEPREAGQHSSQCTLRKSLGQALFRRVQGRAAAGQDKKEHGTQQS